MSWIKSEVPLILGLLSAVLGLLLAFGVTLSQEQVGCIMAVAAAVMAVITRSQVSPKGG